MMQRTTCYAIHRMLLQQKCPLCTAHFTAMPQCHNATSSNMDITAQCHSEMQQQARKIVWPKQPHTKTHLQCTAGDAVALVKCPHIQLPMLPQEPKHSLHNTDMHSHSQSKNMTFLKDLLLRAYCLHECHTDTFQRKIFLAI